VPRNRRSTRRPRITPATLAALAESIDAAHADLPARLPVIRGTVATAVESRSPSKRRRTAVKRGGAIDPTVTIRHADGTSTRYAATLDPSRRKPSTDLPSVHPRKGTEGSHPVTGAPVARDGGFADEPARLNDHLPRVRTLADGRHFTEDLPD
jgi:hypothetical protein